MVLIILQEMLIEYSFTSWSGKKTFLTLEVDLSIKDTSLFIIGQTLGPAWVCSLTAAEWAPMFEQGMGTYLLLNQSSRPISKGP